MWGEAYHLGSHRVLGRKERECQGRVRRAEVALEAEHKDLLVVQAGIELGLPLHADVS